MKYRYYIADLNMGDIVGTDSEKDAKTYALTEEYFVVDTETGMWLLSDGTEQEVTAAEEPDPYDEENPEDEDDEEDSEDK